MTIWPVTVYLHLNTIMFNIILVHTVLSSMTKKMIKLEILNLLVHWFEIDACYFIFVDPDRYIKIAIKLYRKAKKYYVT